VLDETMEDEIMVTVIATGFNSRPKYTGLSVNSSGSVQMGLREDTLTKPRVERITQPSETAYGPERRNGVAMAQPLRETGVVETAQRQTTQLPPIERMYQPRGTLTEKERPTTFEREPVDVSAHISSNSVVRLTPKTDSRHVPSGPRDLKDYDQPAYLRRGISLPPIEEADESNGNAVAQSMAVAESQEAVRQHDADDRPAFLKRIMD
jgi:hypothetical protein